MPNELSKRLSTLSDAAGGLRPFARFVGVAPPTVFAWVRDSAPLESTLQRVAKKTGVSMEWILFGKGDEQTEIAKFQERFSEFSSGPRSKLKMARDRADMTVAKLAATVGMPISKLQAIEEGDSGISEELAYRLANVLPGIDAEELLSGSDTPRVMDDSGMYGTYGAQPAVRMPGHHIRYVPVLSWAQAGKLDSGFLDSAYDHTGVISIDINDPKAFGVQIRGNSMEPRIIEGDNAIVCPGWSPRSGDTVICRTMDGDVMCKLYQPKQGGELVILSSYNPAYPPVELRREEIAWIYPVGQVVQNLRKD